MSTQKITKKQKSINDFTLPQSSVKKITHKGKNLVSSGGDKPATAFFNVKEEDELIVSSISFGTILPAENGEKSLFKGRVQIKQDRQTVTYNIVGEISLKTGEGWYSFTEKE